MSKDRCAALRTPPVCCPVHLYTRDRRGDSPESPFEVTAPQRASGRLFICPGRTCGFAAEIFSLAATDPRICSMRIDCRHGRHEPSGTSADSRTERNQDLVRQEKAESVSSVPT
jgi:hypothetical protein